MFNAPQSVLGKKFPFNKVLAEGLKLLEFCRKLCFAGMVAVELVVDQCHERVLTEKHSSHVGIVFIAARYVWGWRWGVVFARALAWYVMLVPPCFRGRRTICKISAGSRPSEHCRCQVGFFNEPRVTRLRITPSGIRRDDGSSCHRDPS